LAGTMVIAVEEHVCSGGLARVSAWRPVALVLLFLCPYLMLHILTLSANGSLYNSLLCSIIT
jgi:hypothetical protein